MKKYLAVITLAALSLAGCVSHTLVGQRITIASSLQIAPVEKTNSQSTIEEIPEKIAISSLSESNKKILSVIREVADKEAYFHDKGWSREKDGSITYMAFIDIKPPMVGSILFRVNWASLTIEIVPVGSYDETKKAEISEAIAQTVMNELRAKLPYGRFSNKAFRHTVYYPLNFSP